MQEISKIKLAMLVSQMREIADSAGNINGKKSAIIYSEGLKFWAKQILDVINFELDLQKKEINKDK